jgi:hypothetical protein
MKKFTPAERRQLKMDGYTDEEILRMEMESSEEEGEMEEELATNSDTMRQVPWDELRAAGQPEPKRTGLMGGKKTK